MCLRRHENCTITSKPGKSWLEAANMSLYSQHSMKLELPKHLDQVRDTVTEVDRVVSSHKYPGDRRAVMVMGLLSTIMQHHRSMLQLIKSVGTAGSSWALARDILKGTRYGLWINSCATEDQILRIEEADEFPFSIPELTQAIEAAYCTDRFFEGLKNRCGTQLYKLSRSEIFQLGRWEIDRSSGLHLDDGEIREATTIATLCIVLLAGKFLAGQGHSADCELIETLAADYAVRSS